MGSVMIPIIFSNQNLAKDYSMCGGDDSGGSDNDTAEDQLRNQSGKAWNDLSAQVNARGGGYNDQSGASQAALGEGFSQGFESYDEDGGNEFGDLGRDNTPGMVNAINEDFGRNESIPGAFDGTDVSQSGRDLTGRPEAADVKSGGNEGKSVENLGGSTEKTGEGKGSNKTGLTDIAETMFSMNIPGNQRQSQANFVSNVVGVIPGIFINAMGAIANAVDPVTNTGVDERGVEFNVHGERGNVSYTSPEDDPNYGTGRVTMPEDLGITFGPDGPSSSRGDLSPGLTGSSFYDDAVTGIFNSKTSSVKNNNSPAIANNSSSPSFVSGALDTIFDESGNDINSNTAPIVPVREAAAASPIVPETSRFDDNSTVPNDRFRRVAGIFNPNAPFTIERSGLLGT